MKRIAKACFRGIKLSFSLLPKEGSELCAVSKTLRPLHPCVNEINLASNLCLAVLSVFVVCCSMKGTAILTSSPPCCWYWDQNETGTQDFHMCLVKGKLESKVVKLGQRQRRKSCITDLFLFPSPTLRVKHKHCKDLNHPLNHKGFITCHTISWFEIVNIAEIWGKKSSPGSSVSSTDFLWRFIRVKLEVKFSTFDRDNWIYSGSEKLLFVVSEQLISDRILLQMSLQNFPLIKLSFLRRHLTDFAM